MPHGFERHRFVVLKLRLLTCTMFEIARDG